jgi:hypothetical protein
MRFLTAKTPRSPSKKALGDLGVLAVLLLLLSGCGYRLAALKGGTGEGRTIAVPTFANATNGYRIEQRLSEAVRKELIRKTRYHVTTESTGDVVVAGEVRGYGSTPTVFVGGRASQRRRDCSRGTAS